MITALTEAVHAAWREEVDPDRFLELKPVREGLINHDSRVLIATGTLGPEAYLRLGQLGYIVADIARGQHARDWLHGVADTMRARIDSAVMR